MSYEPYKNDFLLKRFEVPYNFDANLIETLSLNFLSEYIYCIFIPAYKDDAFSTFRSARQEKQFTGLTREDYEWHIKHIKKCLPYTKMQVLFQDPLNTVKNIDYYIDLGFTSFCTCNLTQAEEIKKKYPNLEVVASITMGLNYDDIVANKGLYNELFDLIVLEHNFCRDLELIKVLPSELKYALIVNLPCSVHCPGIQHWFIQYRSGLENCRMPYFCPADVDRSWFCSTTIEPGDLPLFYNYIDVYKLEGRSASTDWIMNQLHSYTQFESFPPRPQLYQHESNPELEAKIKAGLDAVGIEEYWNLIKKTSV